MWDLPGPGLEPVFPALAGGFLTTAPTGKSKEPLYFNPERCVLPSGNAPTPISIHFCLHDVFAGCVQTDIARLHLVTLATAIDKNGFRFYSQNKIWSKVKLRMVSQGNCVTGSPAQPILHRVEFAEKSSSHILSRGSS